MIQELAEQLRLKIEQSGLIDLAGGLATVWESGNEKKTKAVFWDYAQEKHVDVVPDNDITSLTYFEEISTAITNHPANPYVAELRLIGWVNTLKGVNTPVLIHQLQGVLKPSFSAGVFSGIKVTFTGLLPEDKGLFSKYEYDNSVKKYLQKPYDAFGLKLIVSFNINPLC